jgi:hypothetical protein
MPVCDLSHPPRIQWQCYDTELVSLTGKHSYTDRPAGPVFWACPKRDVYN